MSYINRLADCHDLHRLRDKLSIMCDLFNDQEIMPYVKEKLLMKENSVPKIER